MARQQFHKHDDCYGVPGLEHRIGQAASGRVEPERDPFEVDADRVIFSPAFRALADKTQVHGRFGPGYADSAIRTRQTHTLEVGRIGRSLGERAAYRGRIGQWIEPRRVGGIIQAAGFAHDLGSFPFGHEGERVVSAFFRQWGDKLVDDAAVRTELQNCDANAQTMRILLTKGGADSHQGLALTAATLGAVLKYPFSVDAGARSRITNDPKFGYFRSEAGKIDELADILGLPETASGYARHPMSYLAEAADDIAYLVADLEDGVRLGCLTEAEAIDLLAPIADRKTASLARGDRLTTLKSDAIGAMIEVCAEVYPDVEARYDHGIGHLFEATAMSEDIGRIREISLDTIYKSPIGDRNSEIGRRALTTVLEATLGVGERSGFDQARVEPPGLSAVEIASSGDDRCRQTVDAITASTDVDMVRLANRLDPDLFVDMTDPPTDGPCLTP